MLTTIIAFATSLNLSCFAEEFLTYETFDKVTQFYTWFMFYVSVKLIAIILTYGYKYYYIKMLLDVTKKAMILCGSLLKMFVIILLLFSTLGMLLFGGNVTSKTLVRYKVAFGSD